ncbi:mandelate racemase/muconate lactonizing enzyme family protein [Aurantibacter crassamenti]|uniref:mandelate racemase/muconate lactonizing enzyme family protein n=1 Tax=Aurantibacter crassamenti TaxID=1837375 RepID=UPI00193934E9|nr:mandelate racemase/muconate lactonizing enzyme family protein [Aurantibacter crassamenti]MBM1107348.1 mandelate racemase/muconate lactonizing enzyme family protein [Aurantibacter crassamenti]
MKRRDFVNKTVAATAISTLGMPLHIDLSAKEKTMQRKIKINKVNSNFEREALHPYRFGGGAVTQLWQSAAWLQSDSGVSKIGLGTQSPLWSDGSVARAHSENGANALMFAMSERALQIIKGSSFTNPVELLDEILTEVHAYGKKITGEADLRKTFALNSLVCVDNAAWLLYASENNIKTFDEMIPEEYRPGLSHRHEKVASIPSFSVGTDVKKIKLAADEGYFIMKLKTGSKGTQTDMLAQDIEFLSNVHKAIGHYETPHTKDGKIPYYIDPNGRYESKETLLRFLDHAKKIGAFDQIAVIEEPLTENNESYVGDVGVTIAADESAHTVQDAINRMDQGYGTIVVKAIAKTLSMTMKIVQACHERKVPCFSADLTVNPILVDWNKSVAARLAPLPMMDIGLLETNGHQYYKNWAKQEAYHPRAGAEWTKTENGVFKVGKSFYEESAGILLPSPHYEELFKVKT